MDPQLIEFLPIVRCPLSKQRLQVMNKAALENLNQAIQAGKLFTSEGERVEKPLQEALVTEDASYVYPVIDTYIAVMLPEKAILTEGAVLSTKLKLSEGKKAVQQFYDDYGWKKTKEGYNDTLTFEDRRPVSEKYWSDCHLRLNKYLPGGKYLLDVASGSIPNDEYLTYSHKYQKRICMDISLLALQEAALRLEGKGIFILGDMVKLPFQDGSIDAVISMHTVYHIPQEEQTAAVAEAYRVLRPEGEAVIVYSWKKSTLMHLTFSLYRPLLRIYKNLRGHKKEGSKTVLTKFGEDRPALFVQQQDYKWFATCIQKQFNARLKVYSAISRSFSNTFIKEKALGRKVAGFLYFLEGLFPSFLGKWGQYPVFILQKPPEAGTVPNINEKADHKKSTIREQHSLSA